MRKRIGGVFPAALTALMGAACLTSATPPPPFDAEAELARWVEVWQTYDLDDAQALFVPDDRLTYFSSERPGLLIGPDTIQAHYASMGFAPGGAIPSGELWVEEVDGAVFGETAVVSAIWFFGDRTDRSAAQRGPMTAVYVWMDGTYRIAHMHFANYESEETAPSS